MKKNLWADAFENVQPTVIERRTDSKDIDVTWTDKKTGAVYKSTEKAVKGPQGNFGVGAAQADLRYRAVMGLPTNQFSTDRPDDPFAGDRLAPEPVVSEMDIQNKIRERAVFDMRREMATTATREPVSGDFEDRGDFFEDSTGRIRDKTFGTVGPFGTEETRQSAPPSKLTRETLTKTSSAVYHKGLERPSKPETIGKLSDKVQVLYGTAFRGLFGNGVVDHVVTRSSNDRPMLREPTAVAHAMMDTGLMKPWVPPNTKTDAPSRPEQTEYAVGARALETLRTRNVVVDTLDLPKAERDDLIKAIGRTILNAMTLLPSGNADRPSHEAHVRDEVQASIASAIEPNLLKGLVPSALLDRPRPEESVHERAHGTSARQSALSDRMPHAEPKVERPVHLGHTAADMPQAFKASVSSLLRRRDPFNQVTDTTSIKSRPETSERSVNAMTTAGFQRSAT